MTRCPTAATDPDLVHAMRGGIVESFHRGAFAVVDAQARVRHSVGDIERPVFPRSAVKVLQALPLVASGAADALGLSDAELALACASHTGEPRHVETALSMLAKAGLDEAALECGMHWPGGEAAARALAREGLQPGARHNNCSGKHAGFLCLGCLMARARGADPRDFVRGYVRPDHPVMREVAAALAATTGVDLARAPMGTDGCSIPTWGLPLRALATGFARVATGEGLTAAHAAAAQRLRAAVAAQPWFVGGTGRFDTRVMERLGERVFCKVGAEGVYCAALPEAGLGVALKMDDGNNARAAEVVMATLLLLLVDLSPSESAFAQSLAVPPLLNWNGIRVGELRASDALQAAVAR